ncbi:hypothetical protein Tco_1419307 [Tanacetum coccineum]
MTAYVCGAGWDTSRDISSSSVHWLAGTSVTVYNGVASSSDILILALPIVTYIWSIFLQSFSIETYKYSFTSIGENSDTLMPTSNLEAQQRTTPSIRARRRQALAYNDIRHFEIVGELDVDLRGIL